MDFFDIFINVKSGLKIILFLPNKVVSNASKRGSRNTKIKQKLHGTYLNYTVSAGWRIHIMATL